MSEVRITCRENPARPEDPKGILEVYVDGNLTALPHVGQDKVIHANGVKWDVHSEPTVKKEEL